ncbi:hemerythrin domain-containing protein [Telmatospirillum sp. J64-1]|uniref:hemerythrin domain-containing protein n=1 Tax=Telmatospirillum sp. J64-1 TaxID=2502183 RepID=UPI00163D7CF6|nr:hemerythrin domain-containing protein [Telmatospirillum sp. J64-1]
MASNQLFEMLKQDHQRVRDLFSQIEQTSNGAKKDREELFHKLKQELIAHAHAEEKVFYPPLHEKQKDMIDEATEEHHEVEKMLGEAEKQPIDSDAWLKCIQQIKEMVEHHVQEEESEIFDNAQKLLGEEDMEHMVEDVEEVKEEEKKHIS